MPKPLFTSGASFSSLLMPSSDWFKATFLLPLLERNRVAFGSAIVVAHSAPVVLGYLFFTVVESIPALDKYKIQPGQHVNQLSTWIRRKFFGGGGGAPSSTKDDEAQKTTPRSFWKCVFDNLLNHAVTVPALVFYPVYTLIHNVSPAAVDTSAPMPSALVVATQLFFFTIVEDALFYWLHRMLHVSWLYPYIHKQHHEFKAPITISAEYAHPVEKVLGNQVPVIAGPLLWPCHPYVTAMWVCLRLCKTMEAHSGYMFPWSPFSCCPAIQTTAAHHDFHHSHNLGCFGSFWRFWDWIGGSDRDYFAFVERRRKQAQEEKQS